MLTIIVFYLIVLVFIVGLGAGIGFLLNWMMPTVELGIGILIGVVATGFCLDLVGRLLNSYDSFVEDDEIDRIVFKPIRTRRSSKRKKQ